MAEQQEFYRNPVAVEARKSIRWLFGGGLGAMVLGIILAATSAPGTETVNTYLGTATADTGDEATYAVGLIIAGVGSAMLWVALIAWGVSLGVKAAKV